MTDWETVVRENVATVQRTVYRLVGNHADAWDCVQETFLEAVRIERRGAVRDWPALLRRVAIARSLDLLRVRIRQQQRHSADADTALLVGREEDPSAQAEANELVEGLRAALAELPRRQAAVFCLSCFEQLTCEQAARQLGIRPTAARMLLSRARRGLQRLLRTTCDTSKNNK